MKWSKRSKLIAILVAGLITWGTSSANALSISTVVPATANIWSAGHATAQSQVGGPGTLAILIDLPAGHDGTITVDSVSGVIDWGSCCQPNGADGVSSTAGANGPAIDYRGIAGINIATSIFLAGVFLNDTEPGDSAPAQLTFANTQFASVSPGLAQSFYIGDGLTGTGSGMTQVINIPEGATRLFLGFHDSAFPSPGFFDDNTGSISLNVNVAVVPIPPAILLFVSALGLTTWIKRRA